MPTLIADRRIPHHITEVLLKSLVCRSTCFEARGLEPECHLLCWNEIRRGVRRTDALHSLYRRDICWILELSLFFRRRDLRELVALEILDSEHTKHVIDDRGRELDVRMTPYHTVRLEPGERELLHIAFERNTVLQSHGHANRKAVHQGSK